MHQARELRRFTVVSVVCASAAALLGAVVLAGWAAGERTLTQFAPGSVSMKPNTAASLLLAGCALLLFHHPRGGTRVRAAAAALAILFCGLVTTGGVLTLIEYLARVDLGVDELLAAERPVSPDTSHPGRMAPGTAAALALVAAATVVTWSPRRAAFGQALALGALVIGLGSVLGIAYEIGFTELPRTTKISLQTALGVTLLAAGVLLARPNEGPVATLTGDEPGAVMARQLLPVAAIALALLGFLRGQGERAGLYGQPVGLAVMVLIALVVLAASIRLTAARLNATHRAREAALRRLAASEQSLRRVLRHLTRAQEGERQRVALELHDDALPALTAISLQLELVREQTDDPATRERLARVEDELRAAAARLRHMTFDLRPDALEREGLAGALRRRLERMSDTLGIDYSLRDGLADGGSSTVREMLFRISLEALNNVARHAQASHIDVVLKREDGRARVRISDDGVGMATTEPPDGHLGLAAIVDRARLAGGGVEIRSQPGEGTTIEFWAPLDARVDADAVV